MSWWVLLLLGVGAGGALLAQPRGLSFRGSTLLGFLLLACGLTSPLLLLLPRMMLAAGAPEDAYVGLWNLWWTRIAAAQGMSPLATSWLFHPGGTSLALHAHNLTYGVASLPLQWIGGLFVSGAADPAAPLRLLCTVYNLLLIASFTLSGYLLYRLALDLTGDRTAAVLAGILFAFCQHRFAQTVRLHLAGTEFLVLSLWSWIALLRRPSPRALLFAAGSFCLLLYASLEYAFHAILLGLVPLLGRGIRRALLETRATQDLPPPEMVDLRKRRWFQASLLTLALGGLLVLPLALQLTARLSHGVPRFDAEVAAARSADLLDFLAPNARHPLWGGPARAVAERLHDSGAMESTGSVGNAGLGIGWIALALFLVAAVAAFRAREGRRWFWGFLCFWLLSLGPRLHLAGAPLSQPPLPQGLLGRALPFLEGSRVPIVYLAPAWICLSLVVASGWAARRQRRSPVSASGLLHGPVIRAAPASRGEVALGAALLLESLAAPLPLIPIEISEVDARVLASPGYYALASLPPPPARAALLGQIVHQQRLVQDVSEAIPLRTPQGNSPFAAPHWEELTRNLGTKGWIAGMPAEEQTRLVGALRRFLGEYKIRFVTLHRRRPALAGDGRSYATTEVCDEARFAAFRENLRRLHPLHERELAGAVLFEFETTEIRE